ncbi:MAG: hypothetical protein WCK41_08465 [Actinomycetes bacterium]
MANEPLRVLRNTFFTSVGFSVLAFQKAQVRRVEIQKSVKPQLEAVHEQLRSATSRITT